MSPFSTMFMALFAWISSSSLAFIYGRDESAHEEYSCINGREYPRQIVLTDGRSAEIKQTLAGCLARALPGLVADLRLPVPISTLEKGMASLIDTMSFVDPLPPFRMKQWQLIVLLFLDALSICRIPLLTSYMTGRRILLPKVLDGAQISAEEYEIMKDLIIPLGRVPQFTMQSGA
nr:putative RNA polymerase II subunit B1 CTD phosphatase RPAP2 homolog isoform X1 [Ipomoea batatas]GMC51591.1 putative RNA polymerase II subunit B1 CTD phosphatase RPAP2 homolog isoform X1 [Ipomoea batatas]GMC53282.1 putative RNA polymerase II subunit B1 CTD phosphatase RPAP2 homolog isoform X1 [Ipomoea batatas]